MMNKTILLSAAIILGFAVLVSSLAYVNTAQASDDSVQGCKNQYPNDPVGERICNGSIGTPNNHEGQ